MQVQKFEPSARTLRNFKDFCKRLESALDDPPTDNRSNKMPGEEKSNNESHQNNNNNNILYKHNPTHSTKQCHTFKKESGKAQKGRENGSPKNTKRGYNPSKEEIHTLAAFHKKAMVNEYKNINKELANFEKKSMSGDKAGK